MAAVDAHRRHVRTSNAIESSFATINLRTRVANGDGSKKAALAMAHNCWAPPRSAFSLDVIQNI